MFTSMCHDKEHWRAYLDAGTNYYATASVYDAVNVNTRATGQFKRPPKIDAYPIPSIVVQKAKQQAKPKTVKDLFRQAQLWSAGTPGARK
jgi:hypothetical protein